MPETKSNSSKSSKPSQPELTEEDKLFRVEQCRQLFAAKPEPTNLSEEDKERYGKMRDSYQSLGINKLTEQNETLPRVHRRQLLSVSLCFGFLFV